MDSQSLGEDASSRRSGSPLPAAPAKSSLVDEFCRRVLDQSPRLPCGGDLGGPVAPADGRRLLGDRIRMNSLGLHAGEVNQPLFMRSQAARQAHRATSQALADSIALCRLSGF